MFGSVLQNDGRNKENWKEEEWQGVRCGGINKELCILYSDSTFWARKMTK